MKFLKSEHMFLQVDRKQKNLIPISGQHGKARR